MIIGHCRRRRFGHFLADLYFYRSSWLHYWGFVSASIFPYRFPALTLYAWRNAWSWKRCYFDFFMRSCIYFLGWAIARHYYKWVLRPYGGFRRRFSKSHHDWCLFYYTHSLHRNRGHVLIDARLYRDDIISKKRFHQYERRASATYYILLRAFLSPIETSSSQNFNARVPARTTFTISRAMLPLRQGFSIHGTRHAQHTNSQCKIRRDGALTCRMPFPAILCQHIKITILLARGRYELTYWRHAPDFRQIEIDIDFSALYATIIIELRHGMPLLN